MRVTIKGLTLKRDRRARSPPHRSASPSEEVDQEHTSETKVLELSPETSWNELWSQNLSDYAQPDQLTFEDEDDPSLNLTVRSSSVHWSLTSVVPEYTNIEKIKIVEDEPSSWSLKQINIDDDFTSFEKLKNEKQPLTANLSPPNASHTHTLVVDENLSITFHRTLRMPDDNASHQLPASFGTFPLYNTASFPKLPESISGKGGIFFPMWQREAMYIDFVHHGKSTNYAIRVNVGNINAISGLDMKERSSQQDYVVVPGQPWLDGILVQSGLVRQFVAMPRKNYTVEGQLANQEKFGGLQIEVIPSSNSSNNSFWYHQPGEPVSITVSTPRAAHLKTGDCVTIMERKERARPFKLRDFFWSAEGLPHKAVLCAVYNHRITRPSDPFSLLSNFDGDANSCKIRISDVQVQSGIQRSCVEMGIAAGAKLMQDIKVDYFPKNWDKSRSRLINVQIFDSSNFESMVHIVPPPTPITKEAYAQAGYSYYLVEEDPESRLEASEALSNVQSVSAIDRRIMLREGTEDEVDPSEPSACSICRVRLCDCVIRPCNHQVCGSCLTANSHSGRCPICNQKWEHIAGFAAPMNIPGEEACDNVVSVVMLDSNEDGRLAFMSRSEMIM